MSNVSDLIYNAFHKKPIEFGDAFNNIMYSKMNELVSSRKSELQQSMFRSKESD